MIQSIRQCSILGCSKPVVARDFCQTHYMRWKRHGHVFSTRPSDWGSKEKHPLYGIWTDIFRRRKNVACEEWIQDFWKFVADVGERPDKNHQLKRIDESGLYCKGNVFWKIRLVNDLEYRNDRAAYAREFQKRMRENNPFHAMKYSLRKYGLTIDKYLEMHDTQNGVCKICFQEEKSIDPKTKRIRRLAVDHCHETGKVRALLCSKCNAGLGHFMDNIENMQKAIEYLILHKRINNVSN